MDRLQAVCFDLDETLLDDGTSYALSIAGACREVTRALPGVDAGRLAEAYRSLSDVYWAEVSERVLRGLLDGQTARLEVWRRTLCSLGVEDDVLALTALDAYSRHRRESFRLFADAAVLLERLRGRVALALITNGASETQWEKARALRLDSYFEAIVVSGDHGVAKPDAAIFRLALERLDVDASAACHVGDSLAADVAGARNAGITAVWLNRQRLGRPPGAPQPDHEIESLAELEALVDL
jgi:putative hydrolase of the HAD superfamily